MINELYKLMQNLFTLFNNPSASPWGEGGNWGQLPLTLPQLCPEIWVNVTSLINAVGRG